MKKSFILAFEPFSEFLIIYKNSGNSMNPDLSSSTSSIMLLISSRLFAKPNPIRGSSSWSTPIEPFPKLSNESKHCWSYCICWSEKSRKWLLPCLHIHFLFFLSSKISLFSIFSFHLYTFELIFCKSKSSLILLSKISIGVYFFWELY
jgi:hypothetical protein